MSRCEKHDTNVRAGHPTSAWSSSIVIVVENYFWFAFLQRRRPYGTALDGVGAVWNEDR
ncbi:hypothetical protein CALCODRAFT_503895 [Calocera cornea HHB12733]|uniref:Uncharacterized protein n=1 Tax=Calocera cornea HHB12733 TaxID=1353952 RepID=A0A165CPJ0_9BASI|nr:hypothetical protein CALCODRAFT_503895 [Calocera cornea HHB12733]